MKLDGPFPSPEIGSGENRGAEINGGGIEDFDLGVDRLFTCHFGIYPLQQPVISLFENSLGTLPVRIAQSGAFHLGTAQVVKHVGLLVQAENQVAQAFAATPLGIEHSHQPGPMGEFARLWALPSVAVHHVLENISRDEL